MKRTLIALISTFALAACGGSSGGGGGGSATGGGTTDPGITPAGDITSGAYIITDPDTPPAITGVVPAPAAESVSTGTAVSVTFSKMIDPATVTGVSLKDSGGASVISDIGTTGIAVVIDPVSPLDPFSEYTVTVSGVKDIDGNTLPSSFDWTFTTDGVADTEKPAVATTIPTGQDEHASVGADVVITFTEPMNPATVADAVSVISGSYAIPGTTTLDPDGRTARFTPDAVFAYDTAHAILVDTTAADLSGNTLGAAVSKTFRTARAIEAGDVIGTDGINRFAAVRADDRQNLVFMAEIAGTSFGLDPLDNFYDTPYVIGKTDPHGKILWMDANFAYNARFFMDAHLAPDGTIIYALTGDRWIDGTPYDGDGNLDLVVGAKNPDGTDSYINRIRFDNASHDDCDMYLNDNGSRIAFGCTVTGFIDGHTNAGGTDVAIHVVDAATGALLNSVQVGSADNDTVQQVAFDSSGDIGVVLLTEGVFEPGATYTAPPDIGFAEYTHDLTTQKEIQQYSTVVTSIDEMHGPISGSYEFVGYEAGDTKARMGTIYGAGLGSNFVETGYATRTPVAAAYNSYGMAVVYDVGDDTVVVSLFNDIESSGTITDFDAGTTGTTPETITIREPNELLVGFEASAFMLPFGAAPIGLENLALVPTYLTGDLK